MAQTSIGYQPVDRDYFARVLAPEEEAFAIEASEPR